jgi:hypothetical protein
MMLMYHKEYLKVDVDEIESERLGSDSFARQYSSSSISFSSSSGDDGENLISRSE